MSGVVRWFVLGLVVGGRSSLAVAVPVALALRGRGGSAASVGRALALSAVAGELVGDKLPVTPSRLAHPQLEARLVAGAVGATALALVRRERVGALSVAAAAGLAGAWTGSVLGASWRAASARSGSGALHPDVRAALVEDAVVLLAARALARA